jgi:hypothetical protein
VRGLIIGALVRMIKGKFQRDRIAHKKSVGNKCLLELHAPKQVFESVVGTQAFESRINIQENHEKTVEFKFIDKKIRAYFARINRCKYSFKWRVRLAALLIAHPSHP